MESVTISRLSASRPRKVPSGADPTLAPILHPLVRLGPVVERGGEGTGIVTSTGIFIPAGKRPRPGTVLAEERALSASRASPPPGSAFARLVRQP